MNEHLCSSCHQSLPADAFRRDGHGQCTWCQWKSPERRAKARYADKRAADAKATRTAAAKNKGYEPRLMVSEDDFVTWYCQTPDRCHYCELTRDESKQLRLRRGGFGYFVSWDIDRLDSTRPYELGNLALSCFVCNLAKGSHFTEAEAKQLGLSVRAIFRTRLQRGGNAA